MSSLFDRFRGRKEPTSAEIAKERLKLVLVTDRSNLSPEKLEEMQREIIHVIKRYIPIDEMEVQINIEQRERKHYLVADVPLNRSPNYGALEAPEPVTDGESWVDAENSEAGERSAANESATASSSDASSETAPDDQTESEEASPAAEDTDESQEKSSGSS